VITEQQQCSYEHLFGGGLGVRAMTKSITVEVERISATL